MRSTSGQSEIIEDATVGKVLQLSDYGELQGKDEFK